MRIVTRPDFDGIVCAALLLEAEDNDMDIFWAEPSEIQAGGPKTKDVGIKDGDIIANLPWHPDCSMWFDHHISNKPDQPVAGAFDIAPSAAGVVYEYYKARGKLDNRFDELILNTDMIDSADLTADQVGSPQDYPYFILSMTIQNHAYKDIPYWNRLIQMLRQLPMDKIMADPEVKDRCQAVVEENNAFSHHLTEHTTLKGDVSVTDFRALEKVPSGNRFLTYSLFPQTYASVKIRYLDAKKDRVLLSVGHSIFNRECRVNVGKLLSQFGGGGHAGAGGCTLKVATAQENIDQILEIMMANKA